MNKTMSVSEAEKLSKPDIQEAANCIKRWQSRAGTDKDHNERKLTTSMYIAMFRYCIQLRLFCIYKDSRYI